MAYDELTTERFRDAIADLKDITEKRMMGGICFLLNGNMIGGADCPKDGAPRFMFRLGKDNQDAGLALGSGQPMEMGGRKMRGFFFVEEAECDDERLGQWIKLAVGFASALPPK